MGPLHATAIPSAVERIRFLMFLYVVGLVLGLLLGLTVGDTLRGIPDAGPAVLLILCAIFAGAFFIMHEEDRSE